jgi:hypothetical protein
MLTMTCMAEVCARSGGIRYGKAFLGGLVTEYLGSETSVLLTVTTTIRTFAVLLASSLGLELTMVIFTRIPVEVWAVLLLVVELYFLWCPLKTTIAATLFLLMINIGLLLPITILVLSQAQAANFFYIYAPFRQAESFDLSLLQLLFGVILMLYIGHVFVIQCAKVVLPRDPSARSLIGGSVAGTACLTVLFIVWMLAVNGAIAPAELVGQMGTAITPLAERFGPSMQVLGSFLLLHRRGKLDGSPRLGPTYLGFTDGQPQFSLDVQLDGTTHRIGLDFARHRDVAAYSTRSQTCGGMAPV